MVACPPNVVDFAHGVIDNPVVVVEVLSKSTRRYDLGEKFGLFERVPSIRDILFLDSKARAAAVHSRTEAVGNWTAVEAEPHGTIHLPSLDATLSMDEIYVDTQPPL